MDEELTALEKLFNAELIDTARDKCTPVEVAKVRLAMEYPSPELEELMTQVGQYLVAEWSDCLCIVLNSVLCPELLDD